jgi:hypothetical protein
MPLNVRVILWAIGVATLLASPTLAKIQRHQDTAPSLANVPGDAHASVSPNASAVTVYAPDVKVPAHPASSLNPDFQLGSER